MVGGIALNPAARRRRMPQYMKSAGARMATATATKARTDIPLDAVERTCEAPDERGSAAFASESDPSGMRSWSKGS